MGKNPPYLHLASCEMFCWYRGREHWKNCLCATVLCTITVWTVVETVLTATFNSCGNRQISTHHKINTPEPIDKKFGTIDYVRERTSCTNFGRNPSTGGFGANGWNITKIICIYSFIPFSLISLPTGQTREWIFTRDSSKDVKLRKDVAFGGYKT